MQLLGILFYSLLLLDLATTSREVTFKIRLLKRKRKPRLAPVHVPPPTISTHGPQEVDWTDPTSQWYLRQGQAFLSSKFIVCQLFRRLVKTKMFKDRIENPEQINFIAAKYAIDSIDYEIILPDTQTINLLPIIVKSKSVLQFHFQVPTALDIVSHHIIKYRKKEGRLHPTGKRFCPWQRRFWEPCPHYTVHVDGQIAVKNFDLVFDMEAHVCDDFFRSLGPYLRSGVALLSSGLEGVRNELLRPFLDAKILDVQVAYDMAKSEFHTKFSTDSPLTPGREQYTADAKWFVQTWMARGWFKSIYQWGANFGSKLALNMLLNSYRYLWRGTCARR